MSRYGMTIPIAGVPLSEHQDWFREMVDCGYTDFWSSEAGGHDGFTPARDGGGLGTRGAAGNCDHPGVYTRTSAPRHECSGARRSGAGAGS